MCFAPHNGADFLNISTARTAQHELLLAFWLPNVHRATATCTFCSEPDVFSTFGHALCATAGYTSWRAQLPKVQQESGVFSNWLPNLLCATMACNFWSLIRPKASLLFDPPEPQNSAKKLWKGTGVVLLWLFYLFAGFDLLFWSFFRGLSSDFFLSDSFSSLTLPTSAASSVQIVGSMISKFPSVISRPATIKLHYFGSSCRPSATKSHHLRVAKPGRRLSKRGPALGARQGWWHPMRMWRLKRQRPQVAVAFLVLASLIKDDS